MNTLLVPFLRQSLIPNGRLGLTRTLQAIKPQDVVVRRLSTLPKVASRPSPVVVPSTIRTISTSSIVKFARSAFNSVRPTYYSRPGGGSGGYGSSNSFWSGFRRKLDNIPHTTVLWTIMGLNGGIFLVWYYAELLARDRRDYSLYRYMRDNFMVGPESLANGRIWTLVTCCFSHNTVNHLLFNSITLYFLAPPVMQLLGVARFLGLYLASGISGSLASCASRIYRSQDGYSLGASGAIYGVASLFACCFPHTKFLLFFVIPVPAWLCISGVFFYDMMSLGKNAYWDGAGHMGGVMAGLLYGLRLRGIIF